MSDPVPQWSGMIVTDKTYLGDDYTVVVLKNGNRLITSSVERMAGDYVRIQSRDGVEIGYWDHEDWAERPALVMGSIIHALATGESFMDKGSVEKVLRVRLRLALDNGMFVVSSGSEIQVVGENGYEVMYWDQTEWEEDPILVMGAIWRSAASWQEGVEDRGGAIDE